MEMTQAVSLVDTRWQVVGPDMLLTGMLRAWLHQACILALFCVFLAVTGIGVAVWGSSGVGVAEVRILLSDGLGEVCLQDTCRRRGAWQRWRRS